MISINLYEIIMQIVNFLILLFLLKKFLFTPLMAFLDKRESTIQTALSDSEANNEKAKALMNEQEKLLQDARLEARDIRMKAEKAAKVEHESIMVKAKKDASSLMANTQKEMAQEVQRVKKELVKFAGNLSLEITKNVIKSDVTASQHDNVVKTYLEKVEA